MLEKSIFFVAGVDRPTEAVVGALKACGIEGVAAHTKAELIQFVNCFSPECLVVLSGCLLDGEIVRLVEDIRRIDHHCPLLIFTATISADAAISAMRAGVSDLIEQTASPEAILATLNALVARHLECHLCQSIDIEPLGHEKLVGSSSRIKQVRRQIGKLAQADANVLITGESGTGKELVADLIHQNSRRRVRRFVAVNCAAVPDSLLESELFGYERGAFTGANMSREGKLQHAAGGTLFLDEVGDMSLAAQAKILRAIDSRVIQRLGSNVDTRVRVRLIAATNQDLEQLVQEKRFRQDLYYRLNVVRLTLPPLRERLEDMPELVYHIVCKLSVGQSGHARNVEGDVVRRFQQYDWPGNIRELRNVLETIMVFSSSRSIGVADIPIEIRHRLKSSKASYSDERTKVLIALNSAHWNRNEAANILGCSRMTLYRKMGKYGIPAIGSETDLAS